MIEDIHGQPIDPLWIAEFCGFFLGEGTIGVYVYPRRYNGRYKDIEYFCVRASVAQRDDNAAVLYDIQSKFGGTVTTCGGVNFTNPQGYNYFRKPQRIWRAERVENIRRVVGALRMSKMPNKKLEVVNIVEEFLALPRVRGQHLSPDIRARCKELHLASKAAHLYQEPTT